jgi:putative acetyltransferase
MIRKYEDSDIDEVMEIWLSSTIDAHNFIDKEYWEKAYQIVKERYLPNSKTLVYQIESKIVGFISVISCDTIGALFIDKNFQRQGIGKKMVDEVKRNFDLLSVSVYQKNLNASEFYKKQNFIFQYSQNDLNTSEMEDVFLFTRGDK